MRTTLSGTQKRKSRQFWAVNEGRVCKVIAWECPPNEFWWCPKLGYSAAIGHEFFETEREAIHMAITNLEAEQSEIQGLLKELRGRNNLSRF